MTTARMHADCMPPDKGGCQVGDDQCPVVNGYVWPDRTGHWITPTLNAGMGVLLKVTCYEPAGAECRLVVVKEASGALRFEGEMVLSPEPPVTEDGGYCQWLEFYAEVGDPGEYYEGPDGHPVVEGPISIRWEPPRGEDDFGAFCWTYLEGER